LNNAQWTRRLFRVGVPIRYLEAIVIATVGLAVSVVCALILGNAHHHHHDADDHHPAHDEHHHDPNLRSAYVHVITDVATSVLAVTVLTGGLFFGWSWLDPTMGIVGAGVVTVRAWGLIRQTSRVLRLTTTWPVNLGPHQAGDRRAFRSAACRWELSGTWPLLLDQART